MSYSALTDIINPDRVECDYCDVRILDAMIMDQSAKLNQISQKFLDKITPKETKDISDYEITRPLKIQKAFRESYSAANSALVRRYLASNSVL